MKKILYRTVLGFGILLPLLPFQAKADFVIQFTDNRQVTVGRYVEEGKTVKVYTPHGTIGFPKADIERISAVPAGQGMRTRLEMVSARATVPAQAFSPGRSARQKITRKAGKADRAGQKNTTPEPTFTAADIERLDTQYADVAQQLRELWEKDLQDVEAGYPEEILLENRRQMNELNKERHALIRTMREASPDDLPRWAR